MVRIGDGRRVTVYRSDLVELFGLIHNLCEDRTWPGSQIPGARAELRLTRALGSGKARQGRQSREGGLQVTVREQQGRRVKHESGEGEMEKCDMRMQQTFSDT